MSSRIKWPAVIKYSGDHELVFVLSENVWNADSSLCSSAYQEGDQLIDSSGAIYDLVTNNSLSDAVAVGMMDLNELTELVRLHASALGNCCISKMVFSSVIDAIEGVSYIKDEH